MIVKILTASGWQTAEQLELFPGKGLSLIDNTLCYGSSTFHIANSAHTSNIQGRLKSLAEIEGMVSKLIPMNEV